MLARLNIYIYISGKCYHHPFARQLLGSIRVAYIFRGTQTVTVFAWLPNVAETWVRGLFWKLSSRLRCVLNVDNAFIGVWLSHCQFGKVHEALCWWSTKRTFFCGTHRVMLFTRSTVATMPRPRLTSDITRYRTWYSMSGYSVNLTCISDD